VRTERFKFKKDGYVTLGWEIMTTNVEKKATSGFIVSLIAGILILVNAVMFVGLAEFVESLGSVLPFIVEDIFVTLAAIGAILAIIVIIGAILIYIPGKETIGGILVIIVSLISIVIGGGFIIGLILGIIGGILGLYKK
jgi:hypothetical protein